VRRFTIAVAVVVCIAAPTAPLEAQGPGLAFSLFERYLDSFRNEAGIPGLSAAILRQGVIVWEGAFGRRDVEANLPVTPDTPFQISGLSQAIGATLVLKECVDQGSAEVTDPVRRWSPPYPDGSTSLRDLASHTAPGGFSYQYSPPRFAALSGPVQVCAGTPYREVLVREILERLAMRDSAPDRLSGTPSPELVTQVGLQRIAQYAAVLDRMAVSYRLAPDNRPQRSTDPRPVPVTAADGIVSSVRDLARFDAALNGTLLLSPTTRTEAWTQVFAGLLPLPTGFGWFVQNYQGEPIVWQFGLIRGGHSGLIVKVPNRGLTLIMLANSDGLAAPYGLERGDVTASLFARLFLRIFLP
jgi:CubicO group peptidase (beta-lactamase class C family)